MSPPRNASMAIGTTNFALFDFRGYSFQRTSAVRQQIDFHNFGAANMVEI